jgi:carbon-monoxide dehydrogenase large subunit
VGEFSIGQGISRFEDARLLRGAGRYVDDIKLPNTAHGIVLRSPHAHARIRSLDVRAARAAPGVLQVLTAADLKKEGIGDLPVPGGLKRRNGEAQYMPRYPILAEDRVRYVGDCVAFVVAETAALALDAVELIKVSFDALPSIISTADATNKDAARVWDDCPDNVCFVELIGNKAAVDASFGKADHIIKHRFTVSRVTAASIEPRAAIGHFDAGSDRYTLYAALQHTHVIRADLAKLVLKVPESKVRVIVPDVGGSFGMKSPLSNEIALVLIASKLTGRPVKWISTRSEAFLSDPQGRDQVSEAELALDRSGTFLALRVKVTAAIGAYLQPGMPALMLNAGSVAGCYRTPAIFADITGVFTNTNPVRPYRGNGRPEFAYIIERMVDLAAGEIEIDPTELRRRNFISPSAMPFKTGLTFTYDSGEFEKNMDLALALADMHGLAERKAKARKRGKLLGLGVSNTIERAGAPSMEGAEIRFSRSGTATIFSGSVAQGQGHETVFKQIVCDRLGLDPNEIHYVQGDSDQVHYSEGTNGSRSTIMAGSAFHIAIEKILDKARLIAGHILNVDSKDLTFVDQVFSSPATNRTITIKEIAVESFNPSKLPQDMEAGLSTSSIYYSPVACYPNGCHICELEIDRDTGAVNVVRYSVVDDVGTVINPNLLHGQIHGGVAQGVGQVLMERIHLDPAGQLVTGSFMDYAMPRAHDLCDIEVKSNPVPTKTNPLGVKGAGEAGCVGALPAVANALVDALSEFGVKYIEMPATSERIWRAMTR